MLNSGGESYFAIGGDSGTGLVVYETADNSIFYNLVTNAPQSHGMVSLVAGGQPGDHAARNIVTLEEAVIAATA
jgi:hypothetical protein